MDPQALDLATKTLTAAIDSLMAKGAPFSPLVYVQKDGQRVPRRVTAGKGEDAAAAAKHLAASEPDADATAFAVDGSIEYDGSRHSGIIVEAWNFRTSRGARVGLRYELKGSVRKKPSLLGSPLHLGREGWYDPEEGQPAPPPAPPPPALPPPEPPAPPMPPVPPVHDLGALGFGPPPSADSLAPADEAPAPPPSSYAAPTPAPAPAPVEPPALPRVFSAPLAEPRTPTAPAPSGFGPPPTSPPVPGFPPPESARPPQQVEQPVPPAPARPPVVSTAPPVVSTAPPVVSTAPPVVSTAPPVVSTAPPSVVRPVEVPSTPPVAAPDYVPVPIQRNETPLGNRAMFAGIMELATKGRSFPAFAIVQKGGDWEQVTMTDASLEDAAASVRAYARTRTDADFIAFAVDGFVTGDGAPVSAVVVEVWEYATRVSFSVAQRYVATGSPPSPRLSGRPLMRTQDGWIDVPSSMTLGGQVQFGYRDPDPV